MEKFYVMWGSGSGAEVRETHNYDQMIEWVREHFNSFERHPTVYYGKKLEFEPAEIVKSWKIKETPR